MNIRRALQVVVFVASVACLASTAGADIIPVEPFTGALTETWESFPLPSGEEDYLSDPSEIMGGAAAISNPFMWIYTYATGFSLGTSGWAQVADGEKGMGLSGFDQTATIAFAEPILRFGAYWGAFTHPIYGGDPAFVNVSFFDEFDDLIGVEVFEYSRSEQGDGLLEWHGWSSSIPIKSIMYTEDGVVTDGLQADPVPEPAMFLLVSLCALVLPRLRKR